MTAAKDPHESGWGLGVETGRVLEGKLSGIRREEGDEEREP